MEGQFLVRQIYEDEVTYNIIAAAVNRLSMLNFRLILHVTALIFIFSLSMQQLIFEKNVAPFEMLVKILISIKISYFFGY